MPQPVTIMANMGKKDEDEKPVVPLSEEEADSIRERMEVLRTWYKQYERLVKDSPNGLQILRLHRGIGVEKTKKQEEEKDKEEEKEEEKKEEPKVEMPAGRTMNELQARLREYIQSCDNGSAHVDDIVEHASKFLGELRRPDGSLYSKANAKKAVIANLRTSTIAKVMFQRDPEKEDHWLVTAEGAALPLPPPREDDDEEDQEGEDEDGDSKEAGDDDAEMGEAQGNKGEEEEGDNSNGQGDEEGSAQGQDQDDTKSSTATGAGAAAAGDGDGNEDTGDTTATSWSNPDGGEDEYEDLASAIKRRRRGAASRGAAKTAAALSAATPAASSNAAGKEDGAATKNEPIKDEAPAIEATTPAAVERKPVNPPLANSSISGSNAPRRGGRRGRNNTAAAAAAAAAAAKNTPTAGDSSTAANTEGEGDNTGDAGAAAGNTRRSTRKRATRSAGSDKPEKGPPAKRARTSAGAGTSGADTPVTDGSAVGEGVNGGNNNGHNDVQMTDNGGTAAPSNTAATAATDAATTGNAAGPGSAPSTTPSSGGGYPGADYVCKCGATSAGASSKAKWKKAPWGDWLCVNCMQQVQKKNYCPICYVIFKENEEDDTNQWIGCDSCHRWLHARCDDITDLSIYDEDVNQDALKYFCPDCRPAGKGPKWQKPVGKTR